MGGVSESAGNEVSASNQRSVGGKSKSRGRSGDPQYAEAKGKLLKVVTSVSPTIAATPKVNKKSKRPATKRT